MRSTIKWHKELIGGKWFSVADIEHVPMIEHCKDGSYKVRNCNGKAIIHIPALRKIPSIKATVRRMIQMFWKQVLVYVLVVLIYTVGVYWVAKPILLERFAGLKWYEVYFYPLYHFILLFKNR